MKTTITITKVEAQWAWSGGYLVVSGDDVEFRVPDTERNRAAYAIGRVVDVAAQPRRAR